MALVCLQKNEQIFQYRIIPENGETEKATFQGFSYFSEVRARGLLNLG